MLAIQPSTTAKTLTPNLLPCSIKHSGPLTIPKRYWDAQPTVQPANSTTAQPEGTQTAYLRGRKLLGKRVKLPAGYTGVVVQRTDSIIPAKRPAPREEEDEDGEEVVLDVKVVEQVARFDEVVVWGHEAVPEDEDPYVKGIGEWIGFAEAIHAYDAPPANGA